MLGLYTAPDLHLIGFPHLVLPVRLDQFEEQRIEQWQMEWAEKGEKRAIAHRKMLEAVLANPDNEPERALQRKLKVRDSKKREQRALATARSTSLKSAINSQEKKAVSLTRRLDPNNPVWRRYLDIARGSGAVVAQGQVHQRGLHISIVRSSVSG